jgi:anti-sigma factor RsiW
MFFRRRIHATDDELSAYLDSALGAGVRERVGGHIDGCAICQEALAGLRAVQTSLRGMRARAPRSFAVREAAVRPAPAGRLSLATPLLSGVTAMAVLAFFAVVSMDMSGDGGGSRSASSGGVTDMTRNIAGPDTSEALPGAAATNAGTYEFAPATDDAAALSGAEQSAQYSQRLTVTAAGAALDGTGGPPAATPEPDTITAPDDDGDGTMKLRIAEGALAALALASGGSALVLVRRRRS